MRSAAPKPPKREGTANGKQPLSIHPYEVDTKSEVAPRGTIEREAAARELLSLCTKALEKETDSVRRGRLHYECARVLEVPLGELEEATKNYQSAFKLIADHEPTVAGLRRVLLRQKRFDDVLSVFDHSARLAERAEDKAALLYDKGRILEDHLKKPAEARAAYEAALELAPLDAGILSSVARVQRAAKAWSALDAIVERQSQVAEADVRLRAARIAERARLTETRGSDANLAAEQYQRAFETEARSSAALRDLERLHEKHRRYRNLVAALEARVLDSSDPTVRATALYRIARVLSGRLMDWSGAAAALERAFREAPMDTLVLEELARIYERTEDHAALASVFERRVERSTDRSSQVDCMMKCARLYEQKLDDEARAIAWYERALSLDPTNIPALQALAKLYVRSKQWPRLVRMHLLEAENASNNLRRAAAHARVAEIQERHLGNRDEAMAQHGRALGMVPGYDPSFRALSRLYHETGRHAELVELYERAVELAADEETRFTYLFKIGRIFEDALDAPQHALFAYRRILKIDDRHFGALHALQRAAERSGEWKTLVQALEHEARLLTDPRRRVALLHRAGEVSEELLRDDEAALSHYRAVLAIEERYAPALGSLGRIHHRAGRWDDLLSVYEKELGLATDAGEKASLLHRMGRLAEEQLGRAEDALGYYRKAATTAASHEAAGHDFQRLLSSLGKHKELITVLEAELKRTTDAEAQAHVALRMAEVYETHLDAPDKALASSERALSARPHRRAALDGRARLLARTSAHQALASALETEAETAVDAMARVGARLSAGEVCRDDLNDPARAARNFEAVLEDVPGHPAALIALESIYSERGEIESLRQVLRAQASTFTDVRARVGALRELVRLDEAQSEIAMSECRAILALLPGDVRALEAAERAAFDLGEAQALAEVDAELAALPKESRAAAHETRLGEYFEPQNPVRALERYQAALARDPENLAAARGVSRVAEAVADPVLLEQAAEGEARVTRDTARAARLLTLAAGLRQGRSDFAGAASALERALEVYPDQLSAAAALVGLLDERGEIDRLIQSLSSAAQRAEDPDVGARHWIAVAGLHADRRGDLPAALAALGRVEKRLPNHVPTLIELAELYVRDRQFGEAAQRYSRALAQSPSDDVALAANLRLAEVHHEHLNDFDAARKALEAVLSRDAQHPQALLRLLRLQVAAGDAAAPETARRLALASPDRKTRADAWTMLGRLRRQAGDDEQAAQAFSEAIRIEGLSSASAAEIKDLFVNQRLNGAAPAWASYVDALSHYVSTSGADAVSLGTAHLELGRVVADELGDPGRAIEVLERGLAVRPEDVPLRVELAGRLRKARSLPRALEELRRLVDIDPLRLDTWRDLSEVFDGMGRNAEAHLALGPLVALGGGSDLQRATWGSRMPRTSAVGDSRFGAQEFTGIDALGASGQSGKQADFGAAAYAVTQLAEGLSKVYGPGLERFGLTSRDKVSNKALHASRIVADRVARIFGVSEFDLYPATSYEGPLAVVLADPVGIVLPASFASRSEAEQVFLLARPLANIARRLHVVDALPAADLAVYLAAVGRTADPSFLPPGVDEAAADALAKRVAKSVSWLSRGRVEDVARAYAQAGPVDAHDFSRRVRLTAARAALIVADDVVTTLQLLRRTEGDQAGLDGARAEVGMRTIRDLLRVWVSDPAMGLRRELGLV